MSLIDTFTRSYVLAAIFDGKLDFVWWSSTFPVRIYQGFVLIFTTVNLENLTSQGKENTQKVAVSFTIVAAGSCLFGSK